MDLQIICLIICSIAIRTVNSINIEGPPLTIYRPCGLSILHFKNIEDKIWQGFLDFGPDQNSDEVDAVISFKEETTLRLITNSNNVTVHRPNNRTLYVHGELPLLEPTIFDVTLNHSVHKVPFIATLTLNADTICNDEIKSSLGHAAPVDVSARCFKQQLQEVCGKRSPDHEELMSLRTEAKAGDWPWAVGVCHSNNYIGGGIIISHSVVITSANIVWNTTVNTITVVAGTSDLTDANQTGRQTVQIAGFGNPLNQTRPVKRLRAIDTEILTGRECKKTYSEINELNLCGYGPTSRFTPTFGDSGSGLVVNIGHNQKTFWLLRGIIIACTKKNENCDPSNYSVYTNVAMYLGWIHYHSASTVVN